MNDQDLPHGIWYERQRKRWRVRLYEGTRVKHLSYHRTLEEALETWAREFNRTRAVDLLTPTGQLTALLQKAI